MRQWGWARGYQGGKAMEQAYATGRRRGAGWPATVTSMAQPVAARVRGGELERALSQRTLRTGNWVLHARANEHYHDEPAGALSVKCMFGGRAIYEAGGGRFAVDESRYLVLNEGQPYTVHIHSPTPVESFCLFFRPGFVEGVLGTLLAPLERRLDEPDAARSLLVLERTHPHDAVLTPLLLGTRIALGASPSPAWLEERFHLVAAALLEVHRGVARQVEDLPPARRPARLELHRRLHRARDYLEASLDASPGLVQLAAVAGLSPHHCLRAFARLFGETPHRYLTRRRLERARELLEATDLPVTRVCLEVGFESLGSFSSLFRRRYGLPPSEYRRRAISKKRAAGVPSTMTP